MQAAIGNSGDVKTFKKKMLDNYTLDAVFSLPTEMFYPGAAAVACCMIFVFPKNTKKQTKKPSLVIIKMTSSSSVKVRSC